MKSCQPIGGTSKAGGAVAGAERNMGDVLIEVFDPEEKELYKEISEAPPAEVLERMTDPTAIDAMVPRPSVNQLMPSANGHT